MLNERQGGVGKTGRNVRRWLDRVAAMPPPSWWLRDPVERASFLLMAAYMLRDRDVKLRLYPGLAPIMVVPLIFVFRGLDASGPGHGRPGQRIHVRLPRPAADAGAEHSAIFAAVSGRLDIFLAEAPIAGPGQIVNGVRRAVLLLITLPVGIGFLAVVWAMSRSPAGLLPRCPALLLQIFSDHPELSGRLYLHFRAAGGGQVGRPRADRRSWRCWNSALARARRRGDGRCRPMGCSPGCSSLEILVVIPLRVLLRRHDRIRARTLALRRVEPRVFSHLERRF